MKVKIGNTVYDPNKTPIMLILTKKDKWNIAHMEESATKYFAFPEGSMTPDEVLAWGEIDPAKLRKMS